MLGFFLNYKNVEMTSALRFGAPTRPRVPVFTYVFALIHTMIQAKDLTG